MKSKKLAKELNNQLNIELRSAYLYLSMAAYLDSKSLEGFSHWMKMQAHEEVLHGMKIYKYLTDQGERVTMLSISQPRVEFKSVLDVFETALKNEKELAETLNDLAALAMKEKDNTTYTFLEWFLTEQVEEISTASSIVEKLKLIGDNGYGILTLSSELGQRPQGTADSETN